MLSPNNSTSNQERRQALRIWMYQNGIPVKRIAQILKVSESYASNLIGQSTMPTRRHAKLVKAFKRLPVELLPRPVDVPSGPRPKGLMPDAFASA